jgi:hypothetical protein
MACAGSAAINPAQYKYSVYSPIESPQAGQATPGYDITHSVVIPNCPMSIPTHFSVLSKNVGGTSSYAPDHTIGITPDGTAITGGTGITPNNTIKLVTNYGEWSFGPQVAPQPGYGGGAFYYVLLNGRKCNMQGAVPFAQQLQVNENGNLFALTFDQLWYEFYNYVWYSNSNTIEMPPGPPPSPAANPPYAVSADGSTLTGSTGSLTTADGVWTIGSDGHAYLNGLLNNSNAFPPFSVSQLQVNAHGQMFLRDTGGTWHYWAGYAWQTTTGPQSGPVPIDVTITRSSAGIPHTSPLGTVMAVVSVTMSDGSTFSGTYFVSLDGNGTQSGVMSGNNLVYNHQYTSPIGASMTIVATQNGSSFNLYFDEQLP